MEKGCVYFFRHIGLTPIKIGYSTHESPIDRFDQFKTYAPYGSELIGFIITNEPRKLEAHFHERFANKRLKGEWFEISEQEVNNEISFHSNIFDIEERNEFQIQWAKKVKFKYHPTIEGIETKYEKNKIVYDFLFSNRQEIIAELNQMPSKKITIGYFYRKIIQPNEMSKEYKIAVRDVCLGVFGSFLQISTWWKTKIIDSLEKMV